ncbi:hypothetical protein GEV33_002785 [Tenebrio molitor]|jgi:hypothetical protein|uniref:Uncharacterized protein n=1 Tax=Tenebrio molitor TaxID=7067 RepID=A0A8J6HQW9_TENMO|nr:hypothetical protein GEV33_002785 [Tenebrio molitor]
MFSSPAIHVFSQENIASVPKKPGATNTLSRRPFIDRAVNGTSPDIRRNLKPQLQRPELKKPEPQCDYKLAPLELNAQDDDLFNYDTYSFKDIEDDFSDIKHLSQKDSLNILRSYCNYRALETPPPEISSDLDMFIEMPESNFFLNSGDYSEELLEESVEDISLPGANLDESDM